MAMDFCLLIDGVPGESLDIWHRDAIGVLSWNWGLSHSGQLGGLTAQSLSLTKSLDRASPLLLVACQSARTFERATLFCTRAGERPLDLLQVVMEGVQVDTHMFGGSAPDQVIETLSLRFSAVQLIYAAQRADGAPDLTHQTPRLALSGGHPHQSG